MSAPAVVLQLLVACGVAFAPASAQSPPRVKRTWGSIGLGGSLSEPGRGNSMATLAVDLNHQSGPQLFQARGQAWVYTENVNEYFNEVALLYGRATQGRSAMLAAAAGISAAQLCDMNSCTSTVGLPIMLRAAMRPVSFLGLATQLVMNVNGTQTVSAIQVMVEIGKLR